MIRYRRGDQRLRQQIKWLALAIGVMLACQLAAVLAIASGHPNGTVIAVALPSTLAMPLRRTLTRPRAAG